MQATEVLPQKVRTEAVTIGAEDGVPLAGMIWEPERTPVEPPAEGKKPKKIKEGDPEAPARAWCVLIHGLLSDRNEFGDLPQRLAERGIGVLAFDVRGHGKSGGPRGVYDVEQAARDVETVKRFLHERNLAWEHAQWDHAPQQWGVVGYSTGGMVALRAAERLHAGDCVVAVAVPRRFRDLSGPLRRLGYWLAYRMASGGNGDKAGPTVPYPVTYKDMFVDRARMEKAKALGFLQRRIPVRNYPLLMALDAEEIAKGCKDPTALVLASDWDKVVPRAHTHDVYTAITSAKTWHEVKGSGHAIWMDNKAEQAIAFTVEWLYERLSAFNEVRPGHTKR